ncbi:MAG: putative transrane protein [Microvirga sp.]|nr:putative transrane protein [Microvirga sp.]
MRVDPDPHEFLASHGGPFFELQEQLKLLRQNALRVGPRAVLFVALAWGVPFLLGLPRSFSLEHGEGAYLADLGVWAKFFIGIGAFVLAEQQIEKGLNAKLFQLVRAPIVAPTAIPAAAAIVSSALCQRDSRGAELACLALAVFASILSYLNFHTAEASSWAVQHSLDGNRVTLAGWWSICFSLPLFVFLFLRGTWRHFVWSRMLRQLATLDLRLVAIHPDGNGGLAFLGQYPNAYAIFVFGMSCAIAAAVAKHHLNEGLTTTTLSTIMSGWLAIVISFFAYPLSAFSLPLNRLKEQGLLLLGAQATNFCRSAERKAIGQNVFADSTPEPDTELSDPGKHYEATRKLSTILVSRASVVPVAAAGLIPFAVVAATTLPYKDVLSVLKKLLVL